jgi:ethanolamine utilization protein EutN
MFLGRVIGCLWSTVKDRHLEGQRLLVVEALTPEFGSTGRRLICADSAGAGAGELVYWCRGKEASFALGSGEAPVDAAIVGIVDSIHLVKPC